MKNHRPKIKGNEPWWNYLDPEQVSGMETIPSFPPSRKKVVILALITFIAVVVFRFYRTSNEFSLYPSKDIIKTKSNSLTISWDPIDGARQYQVYLNGKKIAETKKRKYKLILKKPGKHVVQLKVHSINGEIVSPKRVVISPLSQVGKPQVSFPNHNAALVQFKWKKVKGAKTYQIYLAHSKDMGNSKAKSTEKPQCRWKDLEGGQWYYGRVDVDDGRGSQRKGKVWSFLTPIDQAKPIYPQDHAQNIGVPIQLIWREVKGAEHYEVVLKKSISEEEKKWKTSSNYINVKELEPGTKYYWRVDSVSPVNRKKGQAHYFTTLKITPPKSPFPSSEATKISTKPLLKWKGERKKDISYTVYISREGSFQQIEEIGSTLKTSYIPSASLQPNATYYWRVDVHKKEHLFCGKVWTFRTGKE